MRMYMYLYLCIMYMYLGDLSVERNSSSAWAPHVGVAPSRVPFSFLLRFCMGSNFWATVWQNKFLLLRFYNTAGATRDPSHHIRDSVFQFFYQ